MKIEYLDLHGLSLEEAIQKLELNIKWCIRHQVEILDIIHGKGFHSNRNFSVIKQEVRRLVKEHASLKEAGYIVVFGEANLPITLTFDQGHTLLVQKGLENKSIGGQKQSEKNYQIFSSEAKMNRKIAKQNNKRKKTR